MSQTVLPEVAPPPRPDRIPDLNDLAPVDPALVEYRRRVRRRLVLFSGPVVLVILLVAVKLIGMPVLALTAQGTYAGRAYDRTVASADGLAIVNVFEPWVQHFDRGTGLAGIGVLTDARTELENSLALVPKGDTGAACMVRTDLLLVVEEQGDSAVLDQSFDQASAFYAHALSLYNAAPEGCFRDPSNGQTPKTKKPLQDAHDRLLQKQRQAQQQGGQSGQGQSGGQSGQGQGQSGSGQGQQGQGAPGSGRGSGSQGGKSGQGQGSGLQSQGQQGQGQGSGSNGSSGSSGSSGSGGQSPLQQLQQQDSQAQQQQQQEQNRQRYFSQNPEDYGGKPW
jgi:hypothetical protein